MTHHQETTTHTIRIVQNTAEIVTAEAVIDTYPDSFTNTDEAADYAERIAADFPWGWICSCGQFGTADRTLEQAAFNAPDEHRHFTGRHDQVLILDPHIGDHCGGEPDD
ncbi:hypothetical protein ABN034_07630 [Actinopolymorpha sp. B11F2]|uniref:hypothetical protein n=1 Tax=Actinopolymorpha sp. B11F2 TaxID=3160862 RepID=UPI0032E4892A